MILLAAATLLACTSESKPKSVILITIDTLRADHMSSYGYRSKTSPALDKAMKNGTRFEWAFSTSANTAPSHVSIMTGLYPLDHSVGLSNGHFRLTQSFETLAEHLNENGFRTAAVVSNPILSKKLGLRQGFNSYNDRFEDRELNRPQAERRPEVAVRIALLQLERLAGKPFFMWLHVQDPHGPYTPPARWLKAVGSPQSASETQLPLGTDQSGHRAIPRYQVLGEQRDPAEYIRAYDAEIASTDAALKAFLIAAQENALNDNLLIITSDHGEALGEDEFYFAHSHSVGMDQVHVPLAIIGPGISPGSLEKRAVSIAWIFDTALEHALGEDAPGIRSNLSLLPRNSANPDWQPPPVFMGTLNQVGIVHGSRFARRDLHPPSAAEFWSRPNPINGGFWKPIAPEIQDLPNDRPTPPMETTIRLLNGFADRALSWPERFLKKAEPVERSAEELEALKELGYVQ
jgi:arylsulfatase